MTKKGKGTLVVCATPIGNLDDITPRVLDTLRMAGAVVCEDTRRSLKLLNHFDIKPAALLSYHRHSPEKRYREVLKILGDGRTVALLSDGGTPVLSDPGSDLVKAAREKGHHVTMLPGASAVTGALAISGFPGDSFIFAGFLNRNRNKRREELTELNKQQKTIVLFEAPHRLQETLDDMEEIMPGADTAVVRELTKIYEEVITGTPGELAGHFREVEPRGEVTLVVKPAASDDTELPDTGLREDLRKLIAARISPADAVKAVAILREKPRKKIYAMMLEETREED